MSEIVSPHDRFFKEIFGQPEIAADFLANYLSSAIVSALELTSLELLSGSFIDEELQQHFSDLLYRVRLRGKRKLAFIYLLFEHKISALRA